MPELHLIRHGQASFGAQNYDKLSDLGHQQAVWLGEYYHQRQISFDRIVTGDLVRHHETAQGICTGMQISNCKLDSHSGWDEFDFQKVVAAYVKQYPQQKPDSDTTPKVMFKLLKQAMQAWSVGELNSDEVPETWEQFAERVQQALDHVHRQYGQQEKVLVVSSGGTIAMTMKHILGFGNNMVMNLNMQIMNTSVSRFILSSQQIHLSSFNHTPHLDQQSRSSAITYS